MTDLMREIHRHYIIPKGARVHVCRSGEPVEFALRTSPRTLKLLGAEPTDDFWWWVEVSELG